MKILIVVSKAVLGGHILSALTTARHLQKNRHSVIFAGGRGGLSQIIEKEFTCIDAPIPILHGERNTYFTWSSFSLVNQIRQIVCENDIDIIHAFDARAYVACSIAGLIEKKPITCTLCGGVDPYYNIPATSKIIVFSEEQRFKMIQQYKWAPDRVEVIRTRIDVDKIITDCSLLPIELSLKQDVPIIMMISSFDGTKSLSILQVMDALELLLEEGIVFQMVFIGGKGAFFEEMKQRSASINLKWGSQVITLTGPIIDAYKLLKKATVVLGVGRSAFEGMAFAKPTIVVGAKGFAGLVTDRTAGEIGYYNFSGRNQKHVISCNILAGELKNLLMDTEKQKEAGVFGQQFIFDEIDVKSGISRIVAVYQENIAANTSALRFRQWLSVLKIMVPIWRDNWWYTVGMPLKRMVRVISRQLRV